MKTSEKNPKKIEFTLKNSGAPLSGTQSGNRHPNKDDDKKGSKRDVSELERKRVVAENEAKKLKTREGKR